MKLEGWISGERLFKFLSAGVRGKVLAAFSSGVYLDFCGETVMLHDKEHGYLPFGIAIGDFKGRGKNLGLEPGTEIVCSDGILTCPAVDFFLKIYKAEERKKLCTSDPLPEFVRNTASYPELDKRSGLWVYAPCEPESLDKDNIEDVFARTAHKGLVMLVDALDSCSIELMENALHRLLGLGRGLTPSLDDFLCGMVFTMHYAEGHLGYKQPYLYVLSETLIKNVPMRTNVYSAAYLLSAAAGEDFSLLSECLENSGNTRFFDCVQRLLNVGSSSGADMLSGMCFAANYILKQQGFTV